MNKKKNLGIIFGSDKSGALGINYKKVKEVRCLGEESNINSEEYIDRKLYEKKLIEKFITTIK